MPNRTLVSRLVPLVPAARVSVLAALWLLAAGSELVAQTPAVDPQPSASPAAGPVVAGDSGAPASDAQPATAGQASSRGFLQQVQIVGVADGYYDYNANGMPVVALRNFDTRDRPALSMVKVGVAKTPAANGRFGFRVDVQAGPATAIIHAAEPGTSGALRHLEQAYVSYLAPAGKGLQIDFGEFVTPVGAEVIEAKDNWNYSRSLLFALAIPYYHMGARASYAVNGKLSLSGMAVNGWNNVVDDNRGKTYGVQATVKPTPKLTIEQNYMAGPEQPQNTRDWRQLSDTVITYALTPTLTAMANYDYGRDTIGEALVHWQGIAAYARYQITSRLALSPRVEWYDDANGATSGLPQTLRETTVTGEMRLLRGLLWRVEYRHDGSAVASFERFPGQPVSGQTTFGVGVLYSFEK